MASGSEYAARLADEIRRALARHVASLQEELESQRQSFESSTARLARVAQELGAVDLAGAESLLTAGLEEVSEKTRRELSKRLEHEIVERVERELSDKLRREIGAALEAEVTERLRGEMTARVDTELSQRTRTDYSALGSAAAAIQSKETQEEILQALLDGAYHHAPRVALWIVRGEELTGWASRGYSDGVADKIRHATIERSKSSFLSWAMASGRAQSLRDTPADAALASIVGSESAEPWNGFALRALGRPVAVLFAASDLSRSSDASALGLLVDVTSLCIENLALKVLRESGAARPVDVPASASMPARPQPPPSPGPERPIVPPAPERPIAPPAPTSREAGPVGPREVVEPPSRAEVPPAAGPDRAAAAASHAGAAAAAEPAADASEEGKLHAEAKRFARLLISEIKLYNEKRVNEGRKNRDIYTRLKRDIERSREMYEKRVSPQVAHKADYFHDELIRILGDNDASSLGSDYPGPRVGR